MADPEGVEFYKAVAADHLAAFVAEAAASERWRLAHDTLRGFVSALMAPGPADKTTGPFERYRDALMDAEFPPGETGASDA